MSNPSLRPSVVARHQLAVRQADRIEAILLQRRRELVNALHGGTIEPFATCPQCGHEFSDLEILQGFIPDMRETTCPKCGQYFEPSLQCVIGGAMVYLTYFSAPQTLVQLEGLANANTDDILDANPSLYYSAIVNFGGLKQAFKQLGVTYAYAEELAWCEEVVPFLGTMPDPMIAELVGSSPTSIRRMRYRNGVPAYNRRLDLED